MKKKFEIPELTIINFIDKDIITSSAGDSEEIPDEDYSPDF